jgi:hypothetical protein
MKALRLFLLSIVLVGTFTACKTSTEPENASERPWNAQRGWEHGLPTGINQGR